MIKNQWQKNKIYPLILGAGISFLLGLFIPIEFLSWFGNSTKENSSPNIKVELADAQSSEHSNPTGSSEKPQNQNTTGIQFNPIIYQPQDLSKLGTIPQKLRGKVVNEMVIPSDRKVIALTFDDGPSKERTNDILYVLKTHNIKATFFVLGQNVQTYPDLTLRIVQHGHAIGNHSWSHPYAHQSQASAARQIDKTTELIQKITGVKTELFRPPGGYLNNGLANYAKQKQNAVIMWSVDTSDYRSNSKKIMDNALKNAKSGGIILLHDGGGERRNTLIALPHLIEELQKQGYEFVTIPELLAMGTPK